MTLLHVFLLFLDVGFSSILNFVAHYSTDERANVVNEGCYIILVLLPHGDKVNVTSNFARDDEGTFPFFPVSSCLTSLLSIDRERGRGRQDEQTED